MEDSDAYIRIRGLRKIYTMGRQKVNALAGVDIDIQIPGKKAQSVSLLSGGEKSLAGRATGRGRLSWRNECRTDGLHSCRWPRHLDQPGRRQR